MKNIEGYGSKYCVDEKGNIFRWVIKKRLYKQLNPMKMNNDYLAVDLGLNGVIKRHLVHRLVAFAYLPNPEIKPQVNHINGIKTDNNFNNLEWVTPSENQKHSISAGLRSAKGEKNSQSKLTEKQVLDIRKDNRVNLKIAEYYNISTATISDIKSNRTWKHIL